MAVGDEKLGFSFDIPAADKVEIGFVVDGDIHWAYRIEKDASIQFREYASIPELLTASEGVCGNVYFHAGPDWSKVIVMFNGAVTQEKLNADRTIFQRWSWARYFRHPVICVADPVTLGPRPIGLGWYLGTDTPNALPDLLRGLLDALAARAPDARLVGFGSSGGGFAALGAVLLGLLDEAIVVNAQVDVLKFDHVPSVEAFLARRGPGPCDTDLKQYGFSRMKAGAKVIYLQNRADVHHWDVHFRPFVETVAAAGMDGRFRFIEFADEAAGHFPPPMQDLVTLIGEPFSSLLGKR